MRDVDGEEEGAAGREIVARRGRAYAAVNLAQCEDGLFRYSAEPHYSHGGFAGPISFHAAGHATLAAARAAGLAELLSRWPPPFPSDPHAVRVELADLRRQIESRRRQPTLF